MVILKNFVLIDESGKLRTKFLVYHRFYKFFINSLYVAFTRSVKNLYLVEAKQKHKLYELLGLKDVRENVDIEAQKSTEDDWLLEAQKA